ncbi:MAG: FtsB family cell division protein [Acidithiobacillus sp.]|uniref:FtsB family cell division protein n=1 Tax=Acidithiobacillus sp. TaxID=1872118 RepID=UPI003D08F9C6
MAIAISSRKLETDRIIGLWRALDFSRVDIVLLLVLLLLQYPLWFGAGSWWNVASLQSQLHQREAHLQELEQRNAKLAAQVQSLEHGDGAIADLARRRLGLIGKNEIFVWVIPHDAPTSNPHKS